MINDKGNNKFILKRPITIDKKTCLSEVFGPVLKVSCNQAIIFASAAGVLEEMKNSSLQLNPQNLVTEVHGNSGVRKYYYFSRY